MSWSWPLSSTPLMPDEPGQFGAKRRHDIHTGVDLYCEMGTDVLAVEAGVVTKVVWFTGSQAPGLGEWWNDTLAILIEGDTGVVLYGEVDPSSIVVAEGDMIAKAEKPPELEDPTPFLLKAAPDADIFDLASYQGTRFIDPNAPVKDSQWWSVWKFK